MRTRRIFLISFVVLAVLLFGYFAGRWIVETTTPLSPASGRLVEIFKTNAPSVAEQRVPVVVVENFVCGKFSSRELDDAVATFIPFFWKQEKRMEADNQVWRFERWDLSGYLTLRIVMDAAGGADLCQASIRKG